MNIMLVSVTERTQEIGLRKAIGGTRQDIRVQFLIEAVILSIAGGAIGIGVGIGGAMLVGVFTPLKASIPVGAIALAVGVSGGIGIFFWRHSSPSRCPTLSDRCLEKCLT